MALADLFVSLLGMRICYLYGCDAKHYARGLCANHYAQELRQRHKESDPDALRRRDRAHYERKVANDPDYRRKSREWSRAIHRRRSRDPWFNPKRYQRAKLLRSASTDRRSLSRQMRRDGMTVAAIADHFGVSDRTIYRDLV